MTFAISILKFFFKKRSMIIFSICQNFLVFRRKPPNSNFFKFLKKLNFSMTMRSWELVMVPLFLVGDPLLEKLTIFKIWPYLKLSIFSQQLISPKLLYFGNLEDLGNDVGDFFARKVMQIPNLETVFESELIWNFKNYRFFVISWFDLIYSISVTMGIWEMAWGTFLLAKWFRFRISKPFSNRSKFEILKIIDFLTSAYLT